MLVMALFAGCGTDADPYRDGYKDGWEGNYQTSTDEKYIKGYRQGKEDSDMYESGYRDGRDGKKPQDRYQTNAFYSQGYDDARIGKLPSVKEVSI